MNSQFSPDIQKALAEQAHQRMLDEAAHARLIKKATGARHKQPIWARLRLRKEPAPQKPRLKKREPVRP